MAWNFRKRIKIIPGVYLNVSKNGISTSIGIRGASVTFRHDGTYLNSSIPVIGIYNRQKISSDPRRTYENQQPLPTQIPADNIFSADVQQVTSEDMKGIKELIIAAHNQRRELRKDLGLVRLSLFFSNLTFVVLYVFIIGFFAKSLIHKIQQERIYKRKVIEELIVQIENSRVKLDIEFDPGINDLYEQVVKTFRQMSSSIRIWDVTGAYANDRVATRSAASTSIKMKPVQFGIKILEDIDSKFEPLWMKNANGADLYFYPGFVVMFSGRTNFALIGIDELEFKHDAVSFVETSGVPADSKIIDRTWVKVNKNGSPDRRFKENYQIPIVRYGAILLLTNTGVHEEYMISNYEASESFSRAFIEYQDVIRKFKTIEV